MVDTGLHAEFCIIKASYIFDASTGFWFEEYRTSHTLKSWKLTLSSHWRMQLINYPLHHDLSLHTLSAKSEGRA